MYSKRAWNIGLPSSFRASKYDVILSSNTRNRVHAGILQDEWLLLSLPKGSYIPSSWTTMPLRFLESHKITLFPNRNTCVMSNRPEIHPNRHPLVHQWCSSCVVLLGLLDQKVTAFSFSFCVCKFNKNFINDLIASTIFLDYWIFLDYPSSFRVQKRSYLYRQKKSSKNDLISSSIMKFSTS